MREIILSSGIFSKTGTAIFWLSLSAAQPSWASMSCPKFMRARTERKEMMISTGVPSGRVGISATGTTLLMTPLLPWRPATLSPTVIFLSWATLTLICLITPGSSSSPVSRSRIWTSMTVPDSPWGIFREVSRTSRAFSPKMARKRRSSAVSSVSPLGAILPTRISLGPTLLPIATMPSSVKFFRSCSDTLGISRVSSSGPSLVSMTWASYSLIWTEESKSSLMSRSETTMASS